VALDTNIALANAILNTLDTELPAGSLLQVRSGGVPGAENAATGTLLVEITLPATPWAAASGASKAKSGVWSAVAVGAGTAAHYRLKNAGDTRRIEGTVTATAGGGDCEIDNTIIAIGQTITVSAFAYSLA